MDYLDNIYYNLKKGLILKYDIFKNLLERNNLSLKEFSNIANISYSGCNKWKYAQEVPPWVESWFKLYEENQNFSELKKLLGKLCDGKSL